MATPNDSNKHETDSRRTCSICGQKRWRSQKLVGATQIPHAIPAELNLVGGETPAYLPLACQKCGHVVYVTA